MTKMKRTKVAEKYYGAILDSFGQSRTTLKLAGQLKSKLNNSESYTVKQSSIQV